MSPVAAATSAGAENRASVVPVVPENTDHRTLGTFPTGAIRFSFGPYNTPGQVDRALEALDALCRRTVWL